MRKAQVFVQRRQNDCDNPKDRDPAYDDGGFFFIYDDPVRNKAGVAGKDRAGQSAISPMAAPRLTACVPCCFAASRRTLPVSSPRDPG